jgi:TonB-linked SusC/RagA family outer membrane protein
MKKRKHLSCFGRIKKMLLIMKITAFILMVNIMQVSASVYSQTTKLNINVERVSITEVLDLIKTQTKFEFFYTHEEINKVQKIDLQIEDGTVMEVLDQCFKGLGLGYEIIDDVIIITPAEDVVVDSILQEAIEIKGKITDFDGTPLSGATIMIEETLIGTTTDIDGNYSIKVPDSKVSLKFSFVGYETQIIPVNDKTELNVILKESTTGLNEVVITGMFKKRKETYTGAVTTISEKELKMYGGRDLLSTLNNIDPSFNIIESNEFGSDPNRLPEINIRGTSSIPSIDELKNDVVTNLNTPLFIIDGFEISLQTMKDLNIEDIKSINILKDASATAIYGSRGANGVIVVTTKEPETGKLKLTYFSSVKIELPDLSGYDFLNAREKLDLEVKAGIYNNKNIETDLTLKKTYNKNRLLVEKGYNTDWMSKPLRAGIGQKHNLRLEGGDKKFRYFASLSYDYNVGVMKGSNRKTFNGSINLSYHYKDLTFRNLLTIGITKSENSPYGTFSDYVKLNPYWYPYDEDEKLIRIFDNTDYLWDNNHPANPLYNALLHTVNSNKNTSIRNNFSVEWKLLEGLTMRSRFGISNTIMRSDNFKPGKHTDFDSYRGNDIFRKGSYVYGSGEGFNYDFNFTLSYSKIFKEKHQMYFGLDYSMSENLTEKYNFIAEGFPHEKLDFLSVALQYQKNGKPSGSESKSRRMGITANINYSFEDRYFVDLSYRIDGSSQFGSKKKFAPFWSLGMGWNVHNENFFNKSEFINRLKIIGSYGVTGSQQFSVYQAESMFSYYLNKRYIDRLGANLLGLGNEDLEWQTTKQYNLGFESEFLNKRITLSANFFYKTTSNLISEIEIPLTHGFSSYTENIGKVENKGFEFMAKVLLIKNKEKNIFWSVNFGLAYNKNKIVKLSEALKKQNEEIANNSYGSNPNRLIFEGDPLNAIYVVPSLGIDPSTGKELFKKKNGKVTYIWDIKDRVFAGVSAPKFLGNCGTMLNYGNIQLNLSFGVYWGGQIYNQTLINRVENADKKYNVDRRVYEDRWMKPGDITFFKGINETYSTRYSSRFVQNQAIFQCKNIDLTYKLENDWVKKSLKMQSLKFTCNMGNLFYLSTVKRERGLSYPFSHTVIFSVRATF